MELVLRPARPEDKEAVAAFTQDTFSWGDYVERAFDDWAADPGGLTLVADRGGQVVGLARGSLLSPTEGWAQGLRVHPAHRRRGVATALIGHVAEWAAGRGARVVRLSAEDSNQNAAALIPALGFRPTGRWLMAEREVGGSRPVPRRNGGRRAPAERMRPVPAVDADAAMIAWAGGPLDAAARSLWPQHWCWRRLTLDDLTAAARRGALWEGRPGWVLGTAEEEAFSVDWLATRQEDARALLAALLDLAAAAGAGRLEAKMPAVDWLQTACEQARFWTNSLTVYSLPL